MKPPTTKSQSAEAAAGVELVLVVLATYELPPSSTTSPGLYAVDADHVPTTLKPVVRISQLAPRLFGAAPVEVERAT